MKIGKYIFSGLIFAMLFSVGATSNCLAQATGFFENDFKDPAEFAEWQFEFFQTGRGNSWLNPDNNGYFWYTVASPTQPWQDTVVSPGGAYNQYPSLKLTHAFSGTRWTFETKVLYAMPQSATGRQFVTWVCFGDRNNSISFRREARQLGRGATHDRMRCTVTLDGSVSQQVELSPSGTGTDLYRFRVVRGVKDAQGTLDDKKIQAFWSTDAGVTWTQFGTDIILSTQTVALPQYVMLNGGALNSIDPTSSQDITDAYAMYDYINIQGPVVIKAQDPKYPNDPTKLVEIDENFKLLLGERRRLVATDQTGTTKYKVKWTATKLAPTPAGPYLQLFPQDIGIFFDPDTASSEKEFQTVHLGEVEISVYDATTYDPNDPDKSILATKKIKVENKLGIQLGKQEIKKWDYDVKDAEFKEADINNYYGFDSAIITAADNTGVPPQYIKGHIVQETWPTFSHGSYRYEPGVDWKVIRNCLTNLPFNKYVLDNGTGVTSDNRALRNNFRIDPNWVFPPSDWTSPRNPSPNAQTIGTLENNSQTLINVMCSNIFFNNDKEQNWTKYGTNPKNPKKPGSIDLLMTHWQTTHTDFVAQTILAASYGLFQMLYYNAVDIGGFKDDIGKYGDNPKLLLDPNKNIEVTAKMYIQPNVGYFRKVSKLWSNPTFKDIAEWNTTWGIAFKTWNPNWHGGHYGECVVKNGDSMEPQ